MLAIGEFHSDEPLNSNGLIISLSTRSVTQNKYEQAKIYLFQVDIYLFISAESNIFSRLNYRPSFFLLLLESR